MDDKEEVELELVVVDWDEVALDEPGFGGLDRKFLAIENCPTKNRRPEVCQKEVLFVIFRIISRMPELGTSPSSQ